MIRPRGVEVRFLGFRRVDGLNIYWLPISDTWTASSRRFWTHGGASRHAIALEREFYRSGAIVATRLFDTRKAAQ